MRRMNLLVRLFRALSGESQSAFGEKTGVPAVLLAKYELDAFEPNPSHLERMAEGAGLTLAAGERILDYAGVLRQPRLRAGTGTDGLAEELATVIDSVYQRLLRYPGESSKKEEILRRIEERWRDLPKASSEEVEKWIREGRE